VPSHGPSIAEDFNELAPSAHVQAIHFVCLWMFFMLLIDFSHSHYACPPLFCVCFKFLCVPDSSFPFVFRFFFSCRLRPRDFSFVFILYSVLYCRPKLYSLQSFLHYSALPLLLGLFFNVSVYRGAGRASRRRFDIASHSPFNGFVWSFVSLEICESR